MRFKLVWVLKYDLIFQEKYDIENFRKKAMVLA